MDDFENNFDAELADTFATAQAAEEQMVRTMADERLTANEIHLIEAVGRAGEEGSTVTTLAGDLKVTLPAVTNAVKKLVARGFLAKQKNVNDARSVLVLLTHKGDRINALRKKFREQMAASVAQELSAEERRALIKGISTLKNFFSSVKTNDGQDLDEL